MAMTSVPIRTNAELRPSRLFSSMFGYIKKSMLTILRAYMMYKPLKAFTVIAAVPTIAGILLGIRYIIRFINGVGGGNIQSLILCSMLIIIGVQTFVMGMLADVISANRKIMQDVQYKVRKMYYASDACEHDGEHKDGADEAPMS